MHLSHPLLGRRPLRASPSIRPLCEAPDVQLAQGRVHEACGTARRSFAMWLNAQTQGPVIWIAQPWLREKLNGDGVRDWIDPGRLVFVHASRPEDVLWTMEEVLRSGAVSIAIADLTGLPSLTQVRRMHLAAETGTNEGQCAPLGLLLTPGMGGAAGVETRWHLSPNHSANQEVWRLERLRARTAPHQIWNIGRTTPATQPTIKTA